MKNILLLLFAMCINVVAQLPTKLEVLQQKRDKAIENINQIYKQELQKLLNDPDIKNAPAELAKVQYELGVVPNKPQLQALNITSVDLKEVERRFVNKAWKTPFGTTFHFEKDGQGWKTTGSDRTVFTWKLLPDGVMEYAGRVTSASEVKIEYFNFVSRKEAYNGKEKTNMAVPLTLVD